MYVGTYAARVLLAATAIVSANNVYFHEFSYIKLEPNPTTDHDSFGFSLTYQNGISRNLLTGAPHSNLVGKVFKCSIDDVMTNKTSKCQDMNIDVDRLAPYSREYTPSLKLNLGASIAATPDYFFTCAPLWTSTPTGTSKNFSYGTCFFYDDSAHRYQGMYEKYHKNPQAVSPFDSINGGTGWTTLVDQANELLMIAKVTLKADIISINSSNPLEQANSFVATSIDKSRKINWDYLKNYRNVGYSMAAGQFFKNDTVYAVSATTNSVDGAIHFLYAKMSRHEKNVKKLHFLAIRSLNYVKITENTIGSMFGAAMCSADLNLDGLSELLVGAPAQDDNEGGFETGAVHIYLGGDMKTINSESRHRVILGVEDGSRFGAALATNDIDGDNYPEIFIGAPYEDFGVGALYILSGYEVYKELLRYGDYKQISFCHLKLSQKIYNKRFKTFGYSLQTIPDMDGNGCDELAVGSPGINSIVLMRCMPSVNVTVTAELLGAQTVKEQDNEFVVNVCVIVTHMKKKNYYAELLVSNEVIGNGALIEEAQRKFSMLMPEQEKSKCHKIPVKLVHNEPGEYRFTTKVEMDGPSTLHVENFNSSWVTLSPQSVMEASVDVSRHCTGKDCEPNLAMKINWLGSGDTYNLGSSDSITVSLTVENIGNSSFDGCAWVRVSGAPVAQIGCINYNEGYKCFMPKPLRRNAKHEIQIKLNMSQPTNLDTELFLQAYLYDFCKQPDIRKEYNFTLPYNLSSQHVLLEGLSYNQTVTDVTIRDGKIPTINDAQEYLVVNEGSVTWKSLNALTSMDSRPYIQDYRMSPFELYGCEKYETMERILFNCTFDLKPHTTAKFIASSVISKDNLLNSFVDGKLMVTSSFSLYMTATTDVKRTSLSTVITLQKELSIGQNKTSIIILAIVGAAIALAIVILILYKMDFFKRKEKTKLEALKQDHIRKHSVKQSMSSNPDKDLHFDEGLEMEVEDDSAFEIIEMNEPVLKEKK